MPIVRISAILFSMIQNIETNPDICNGKAVIKGTRITVSTVIGFLSAGDSIDDIRKGYPQLSYEDILACLDYAKHLTDQHVTIRLNA